jgi:hypothetical protein
MRRTFPEIRLYLMVGIGGGVPVPEEDIRLGDVVVSQPKNDHGGVIQYDSGKDTPWGFTKTGSLDSPPGVLLSAVSTMRANDIRRRNSPWGHLQRLNSIYISI